MLRWSRSTDRGDNVKTLKPRRFYPPGLFFVVALKSVDARDEHGHDERTLLLRLPFAPEKQQAGFA
jgi:hypothetical protein